MEFPVSVQANNGCPAFNDSLHRSNVFLGTNGSGKSKLLKQIGDSLRGTRSDYKIIQTIGGRAITFTSLVSGGSVERSSPEDLSKAWEDAYSSSYSQHNAPPNGHLPQHRLAGALKQLANILAVEDRDYRKRLYAWGITDRSNEAPKPRESPLQSLLDLFTEVFPNITISLGETNNSEYDDGDELRVSLNFSLECKKNGQSYPINDLSDGEKQILASLVDRYFLRNTPSIFIIDEPELNLDPQLACDFWSLMEREMPASAFVYATHSIDFALREKVDKIWMIGQAGPTELNHETLLSLPIDQQRLFLGGIRGVLAADLGVVVEGTEQSIDATFYGWLLEGLGKICIRGYGGCQEVADATQRLDIWSQIAPTAKIIGIIDRDYRSDEELRITKETHHIFLDYHDAESYLCHPGLLVRLAEKLNIEEFPTRKELEDNIERFFSSTTYKTAASRMARRCRVRRNVSIPNEKLEKINSEAELIETASKYANLDQKNPPAETSPDNVKAIIRDELRICKRAIQEKDIDAMLRLGRGKELLHQCASLFGFEDGSTIARYVSRNLKAADFPHLKMLRDRITDRLGIRQESL